MRRCRSTALFTNLDAARCEVVDTSPGSLKIRHPDLPRPLWFSFSGSGNLCWRKTTPGGPARIYLIRKEDPGFGALAAHLRRAPCGCPLEPERYPGAWYCPNCGGRWRDPTPEEEAEERRRATAWGSQPRGGLA